MKSSASWANTYLTALWDPFEVSSWLSERSPSAGQLPADNTATRVARHTRQPYDRSSSVHHTTRQVVGRQLVEKASTVVTYRSGKTAVVARLLRNDTLAPWPKLWRQCLTLQSAVASDGYISKCSDAIQV